LETKLESYCEYTGHRVLDLDDADEEPAMVTSDRVRTSDIMAGMSGDNLFANSLVFSSATADASAFQITHHDLWDYDLPAPPH